MRQTMPASELGWAQLGLTRVRLAGLALLALVYLVALPVWFAGSNYILGVLTNASILSFISLGVWVTFAIGRINISQGAFALIGGAYIATNYFPASRAATLIGATQMFGMAGGSAGQFLVGPALPAARRSGRGCDRHDHRHRHPAPARRLFRHDHAQPHRGGAARVPERRRVHSGRIRPRQHPPPGRAGVTGRTRRAP